MGGSIENNPPSGFPSFFLLERHEGVCKIRLRFPLQKGRFPIALSLCGPTYDRDTPA